MTLKRYIPMADDDLWEFLELQRIASIATLTSEGLPHSTPVWFVIEGRKLFFRVQSYKAKFRNISQFSTVSCSFEDGDKYTELRGVSILGKAQVITDLAMYNRINLKLLEKYKNERNYEEMPEAWRVKFEAEPRKIVEITPLHIYSWDNREWCKSQSDHHG
jgi:nitroimidazol reductase NimA-like FMN-containing flavoprotein (pyridoxamine 5'-phosphate oxidase superfamily)